MKKLFAIALLAVLATGATACPKGYFPRNQSTAPGGGLSDVNCGGLDTSTGCGASNYGGGGLDNYGAGGLDNYGGGGLDNYNKGGLDNYNGGGLDNYGGGGLDNYNCGGLDTSPCGGMYTGNDLSRQYCSKIAPWPRYIQELLKRGKKTEAETFVRALRATGAWK